MKSFMLILGLITLFTVARQTAYSCTCASLKGTEVVAKDSSPVKPDSATTKEGLGGQDTALFTGQVVKIEKVKVKKLDTRSTMNKVTVKVERYWIGVKGPEVTIYTARGNGSCGVSYTKGKKYFFWAAADSGRWETGACAPKEIDNELIPVLNELFGAAKAFPKVGSGL